jgi:hypothetical protein
MKFELIQEQWSKFHSWKQEQDKKVQEIQGSDSPCYGAIGGAYTFSFTPTSLGVALVVKNNRTKDELDITDYENW